MSKPNKSIFLFMCIQNQLDRLILKSDGNIFLLCLRDPIHAGGGAGPRRARLHQRRATLLPHGADAENSLQSHVLH